MAKLAIKDTQGSKKSPMHITRIRLQWGTDQYFMAYLGVILSGLKEMGLIHPVKRPGALYTDFLLIYRLEKI